jgi:hypothetical protein
VPVLDQGGARKTSTRTVYGTEYRIAFYRPRVEGLFSRIERWTASGTGLSHWRTISRENVTAIYGADQASQVSDPADSARVFSWQISRSWDDKGNLTAYGYAAEDGSGVDRTAAHEANRTAGARAAQRYLKTSVTGTFSPTSPTGARRPTPRSPPTGCSPWSLTTAITQPCRRRRRPTSRGRCGPIRSPATAPGSRSVPTGGSSGCCSSITSPLSRRLALHAWPGHSTSPIPTSWPRQIRVTPATPSWHRSPTPATGWTARI